MDAFWIGLNDLDHEMSFEWDDKVPPSFTFWEKEQPNDVFGEIIRLVDKRFREIYDFKAGLRATTINWAGMLSIKIVSTNGKSALT